jgi:hypothetical protein
MNLIVHEYHNTIISQRPEDGYINLNEMAEATGKRLDNWLQNQATKELFSEFLSQQNKIPGIPGILSEPIVSIRGRSGGTWAHPDIAIQFAQWCSPAFALQVSRWIREWMTTENSPIDRGAASRLDISTTLELIDYRCKALKDAGVPPQLVEPERLELMAQAFPEHPWLRGTTDNAKAIIAANNSLSSRPMSPTELGQAIAQHLNLEKVPSPVLVNKVLLDAGLQKIYYRKNSKSEMIRDGYQLTETGEQYGQTQQTIAQNSQGVVCKVRWYRSVIDRIAANFS